MLRRYKTRVVPSSATLASATRCFSSGNKNSGNSSPVVKSGSSSAVRYDINGDPIPGASSSSSSSSGSQKGQSSSVFGGTFEEQMVSMGTSFMGDLAKRFPNMPFASAMTDFATEREWKCWCGHVFRAPGQWIPTSRTMCQAPGCPDRDFFISGEGAKRLEAGDGGKPLESKPVGKK